MRPQPAIARPQPCMFMVGLVQQGHDRHHGHLPFRHLQRLGIVPRPFELRFRNRCRVRLWLRSFRTCAFDLDFDDFDGFVGQVLEHMCVCGAPDRIPCMMGDLFRTSVGIRAPFPHIRKVNDHAVRMRMHRSLFVGRMYGPNHTYNAVVDFDSRTTEALLRD